MLRQLGETKRISRGDLGEWDDHPRGHSRKDRRRWCRGKVGVEHTPTIRDDPKDTVFGQCGPNRYLPDRWVCVEQEYCTACGKILKYRLDRCTKRQVEA